MQQKIHRSETPGQEQYEQQIYDQQCLNDDRGGAGNYKFDQMTSLDDPGKTTCFRSKLKGMVKKVFPQAAQDSKILFELSRLERKVKKEISNSNLFPEIEKVAVVRRGLELCPEEQEYIGKRKLTTRDAFAKYIGVDPEDVNPEDVPTISFGGSGGGFRAMIGCLGYLSQMKKAGLWDCITYVSGVSGSCWSLAAYYTFGEANFDKVIDHCKKRLSPYHPLSGEAIRTLLSAPDGPHHILGPLVQKHQSGLKTVAMDLYAVFISGWIFFQHHPMTHPTRHLHSELTGLHPCWFRYSTARKYIDDGSEPLPIMTAVRHERPWKDWKDEEQPFADPDHGRGDHVSAENAWFQWYEMTPYEIGCDEIAAWCPTWGFGRPFEEGRSVMQLPEQSLALLLGLCTSAPAGPLTSYIFTIARNLPHGFLGDSIHKIAHKMANMWGKKGTEEFQEHHPLHACNEHNFMYHYSNPGAGKSRPPGLESSPRIQLIDSGMDNNCPTYVLLHPSRKTDVIINMDASSDVQKDTFQERIDQIGSRRGLKFTKRVSVKPDIDLRETCHYRGLYAQIYDGKPCLRPKTVIDSYGRLVTNPPAPVYERECTMIYMPLLPNEEAVPGFNPSTARFSGSYNLVWSPEQVETLVKVCAQNFEHGQQTVKKALREAWQRRKLERETRMS